MQASNSEMRQSPSPLPTEEPPGGEALTVEQAIANLQGADLGLRFYSAWWLGRFRVREEAAILALIAALDDEEDCTAAGGYPLRRNAARALGKLGDRRAVQPLIHSLQCSDFYVREAAAQALEQLGDPACVPALLQLLQTPPAPGDTSPLAQPYDALLEALGTLQAQEAIPVIQAFLTYPVDRVRYSAVRAMCQLSATPQAAEPYGDELIAALLHTNLQLRRSVLMDLGAIGYLPAATAIAQTRAENSLKLISLKGLLEKELQQLPLPALSEGAIRVMTLMDELL